MAVPRRGGAATGSDRFTLHSMAGGFADATFAILGRNWRVFEPVAGLELLEQTEMEGPAGIAGGRWTAEIGPGGRPLDVHS